MSHMDNPDSLSDASDAPSVLRYTYFNKPGFLPKIFAFELFCCKKWEKWCVHKRDDLVERPRMSDAKEFIPTRQSLLSRLRDWNDQESWKVFFDTYWKLIYNAARRAGLSEAEAQDVVQDTVISVSKSMPNFKYHEDQGSFKSWLL